MAVMGITVPQLLAALPIREQPSSSPSTAVPEWVAFSVGLAIGLLLIAALLLVGRRRRRRRAPDESGPWAAMDELCREGWAAQLTLYGGRASVPDDAPEIAGVRVRVEWAELTENEYGDLEPAVTRSFWSKSIAGALAAMVQDRDVDHQLEEIERSHAGREPPGPPE